MGDNFVVARVDQHTRSSIKGIQIHNDRKAKNHKNVDLVPERTHMNVELIPTRGKKLYTEVFDKLVKDGKISTSGLKGDAYIFNEILHDVNSEYWLSYEEHGFKSPEEFAMAHFRDCLKFDKEKYGEDQIVSAEIHFDEINTRLTKKYGYPVYHYHMHVVAIPTVEKVKLWSKRCKDPNLVGTVKERFQQVSNSKFWQSYYGQPNSYTLFQDEIAEYLIKKYPDLKRGEKGSKTEHLAPDEYKQLQDDLREQQEINDKLRKENEKIKAENEMLKEENDALKRDSAMELYVKQQQAQEVKALREERSEIIRELEAFEKRAEAIMETKIEFPEVPVPEDKVDFINWCITHIRGVFEALERFCRERYQEFVKMAQKPILDDVEVLKGQGQSLLDKINRAKPLSEATKKSAPKSKGYERE